MLAQQGADIRIRLPRHGKSQPWSPSCTYARASVQPNVLAQAITHTNSNQQKTLLLLYVSTPARAETCICAVPSRPPKTLNTTIISHTLIASANLLSRAISSEKSYAERALTFAGFGPLALCFDSRNPHILPVYTNEKPTISFVCIRISCPKRCS